MSAPEPTETREQSSSVIVDATAGAAVFKFAIERMVMVFGQRGKRRSGMGTDRDESAGVESGLGWENNRVDGLTRDARRLERQRGR